jgi:hypothetical protein|tara:strand:+ start:10533 stop:11300 length:768 start_codon:yes stop_codon:yes gene_type:complete
MYSLLQKKPTVQKNPYPHVVVEDALPWALYEELENTFPEQQVMQQQNAYDNGICFRLKADKMLDPKANLPAVWQEFAQYHTSAKWFNEVNELFRSYMPDVLDKTFTENDLGARGWADESKNIWTDCQLVMHKPVVEKTTRTPHIDNPMEMWAGLLYMPFQNDTSTGGEFQIYSTQTNVQKVNKKAGRQIYESDLGKVVKTIPYKRNTFVLFANHSPNTVHGVSLRQNATLNRRSVNIIGEFKRGYATMYNVQEVR